MRPPLGVWRNEPPALHTVPSGQTDTLDGRLAGKIFATNMACTFKLGTMILPQLERGNHGADVVGMMFFDDNLFRLRVGDPFGERLAKVAWE
jgi:hypothetical protein